MRKSIRIQGSLGLIAILFHVGTAKSQVSGQPGAVKPLSAQMASTAMEIWQEGPPRWSYDQGVVLDGIEGLWRRTGNTEYFRFIQKSMDKFISEDGTIATYEQDHFNIDNVKNGCSLLTLYKETGQQKYLKAATQLWDQLHVQPRTTDGGFWHKKIYPNQMWLDGLYMGEPFYARYAAMVNDKPAFGDIAKQFILMEKHARDAKTGLLYHGWDESKVQKWADSKSGLSPHVWARAMGWYGMALVDVLQNFPLEHPKRKALLAILNRFAVAVKKVQEPKSGLWYDIIDRPQGKGNYFESSASAMFVYALAKGVRKGYLPASFLETAKIGYKGMQDTFIEKRADGQVNLKGTVSVSGLGGKPYRDGSFEYYMSEKVITNDPKGVGAFIMAANEMEQQLNIKY